MNYGKEAIDYPRLMMDLIAVISWCVLAIGYFLSLFVSAYYAYIRNAKPLDIVAKLVFSLIIYTVLTIPVLFIAGMVLFTGAHAHPIGSVLDIIQVVITSAFILLYVAAAWLCCSFIIGRLIWPASLGRNYH